MTTSARLTSLMSRDTARSRSGAPSAPKIGLILVNINPAYRLHELEYALNKVRCRALVLPRRFKTSHYLDMLMELAPELRHAQAGLLQSERLPSLLAPGSSTLCQLIDYQESARVRR